jgi:hypothetical protein
MELFNIGGMCPETNYIFMGESCFRFLSSIWGTAGEGSRGFNKIEERNFTGVLMRSKGLDMG